MSEPKSGGIAGTEARDSATGGTSGKTETTETGGSPASGMLGSNASGAPGAPGAPGAGHESAGIGGKSSQTSTSQTGAGGATSGDPNYDDSDAGVQSGVAGAAGVAGVKSTAGESGGAGVAGAGGVSGTGASETAGTSEQPTGGVAGSAESGAAAGTGGEMTQPPGMTAGSAAPVYPVEPVDLPIVPPPPTARVPTGEYKLVFGDEFDGDTLARSRWCTRLLWDGGSPLESSDEANDPACTGPNRAAGSLDFLRGENQRYVSVNTLGEPTHIVSDGTLKLRATKTRNVDAAPYESGLIRSRFSFAPSPTVSYYITARMRIPEVRGTFAAMWLVNGFGSGGPLAWPPEIDIFEAALNELEDTADMVRMGAHPGVGGAQTKTGATDFTEYSTAFNPNFSNYKGPSSLRNVWIEFSLLWTAENICYFANDERAMCENYHWLTNDGAVANPAQLLLNLAIGGDWAGRHGIDDTKIPTALEIDYVRVYAGQ